MNKKKPIILLLFIAFLLCGCNINLQKAFMKNVQNLNADLVAIKDSNYIKNNAEFIKTSAFWLNDEELLFIMTSNIENEDGTRGNNRLVRVNIANGDNILIHEGKDFIPYLGAEHFNWLSENKGLLQIPQYAIYLDFDKNQVKKIDHYPDINFYQIDSKSRNIIFQGQGGIRIGKNGKIDNSKLAVPDDIPEDFNPDNAHKFNEYNMACTYSPDGQKTAFLNVVRDLRADKLLIANSKSEVFSEYKSENIMNYFWLPNSQYIITEKWDENIMSDIELCKVDLNGKAINKLQFHKVSINIKDVSNKGVLYEKHDMFTENGMQSLVYWSFENNKEYTLLETVQPIIDCAFAPNGNKVAVIIGQYAGILDILPNK